MSSAMRGEPALGSEADDAPRTFPLPFRHIACCVDESEASDYALAEAARLRAISPGSLTIVHAISDPAHALAGSAALARIREWHDELVSVVPGAIGEIIVGDPASAICHWAATSKVDLLVAAPRHDVRERALLGSFAGHLVHHAPCSTLLCRPPETAAQPTETTYANIACCVDRSAASRRALRLARRLRAVGPGRLTALNATYLPPMSDLARVHGYEPAGEELVGMVAPWLLSRTWEAPEVEPVVVDGYPSRACEAWAREHGCDLLVAGAYHGPIERALLGGFAGHLAHHAPCSVLVTRRPVRPARRGARN